MKKLFIILLIPLTGCFGVYSFKPVGSMSNSQLEREYNKIEVKLKKKERTLAKERTPHTGSVKTSYHTTGYWIGNQYHSVTTPYNDYSDVYAAAILNLFTLGFLANTSIDAQALMGRLNELGLEMSNRGLYP